MLCNAARKNVGQKHADSPLLPVGKLILEEIEAGAYPVGSLIPTEKELSQMFDISRTTVRQAIADLVQKDRLYRVKSKGAPLWRVPRSDRAFIQNIQSFADDVSSAGRTPRTEILDMRVVELPQDVAFR